MVNQWCHLKVLEHAASWEGSSLSSVPAGGYALNCPTCPWSTQSAPGTTPNRRYGVQLSDGMSANQARLAGLRGFVAP